MHMSTSGSWRGIEVLRERDARWPRVSIHSTVRADCATLTHATGKLLDALEDGFQNLQNTNSPVAH